MNREELIKLLQSWLTTATDDNGNPIHVIMDVDIHEIATEIIKSSIPPAEGAEQRIRVRNILQDFYRRGEYELEQAEEDIMRLFQQHPTAEGAEEILLRQRNGEDKPITYAVGKDGWVYKMILRAMTEFATLHAQRIADKMVEERLMEELIGYDKFLSNTYWGISHIIKRDEAVDEYLKSRER